MAFDRIDPIGADRMDVLAAMQSYAVVAAAGGKNISPSLFMPRWGEGTEPADEQSRANELWAVMSGGAPRTKAAYEKWLAEKKGA